MDPSNRRLTPVRATCFLHSGLKRHLDFQEVKQLKVLRVGGLDGRGHV